MNGEINSLRNERLLIVGGSGAMGTAIAARAIYAGGEAVLVGRESDALAAVAARLGKDVRTLVGDFTDPAEAARLMALAGRVDHLVVALSSGGSRATSIPATDLTGFRGAFGRLWASYNALHLSPKFVSEHGSITLISGSSGRRPGRGFGVWTTLHGSIEGLARAAAIELAPVRVNVVSPGGIGMRPDRQLVEHAGQPDDVAQAVLGLIANPAITGAVLDVDGGERLGTWSGKPKQQRDD